MTFSCPACGSENTQKVSLIYASGTSSTESTTLGAGLVGHRGAVGIGSTKSSNRSALAQQYAPPLKKDVNRQGWWALFGIIPAAMIGDACNSDLVGILVWILIVVALLVSTRNAMRYNRAIYPVRYEAWSKRMLCLRCGNSFSS
jgi:hypothetical protein